MLKLNTVVDIAYNVEVDYYTPLTIEIAGLSPFSQKNYYRLIESSSLIEIGLDVNSNQLLNVILVQASEVSLVDWIEIKNIEEKQGVPIFQKDIIFTNGLHDLYQGFELFLSEEMMKIQLTNNEDVFYVSSGRVKFGFAENRSLNNIIVKDLTNIEFRELKDSFNL